MGRRIKLEKTIQKKKKKKKSTKKMADCHQQFQTVSRAVGADRSSYARVDSCSDRPTGHLIKPFSNDDDGTRPLSNSVGSIDRSIYQNKPHKQTKKKRRATRSQFFSAFVAGQTNHFVFLFRPAKVGYK